MAKLLILLRLHLIIIFVFIFSFLPLIEVDAAAAKVYAPRAYTDSSGKEVRIATDKNGQYSKYYSSNGKSDSNPNGASGDAAAEAVGCGAGQLLGSVVRKAVSGVVGSVGNAVAGKVVNKATSAVGGKDVPVSDEKNTSQNEATRNLVNTLTGKENGSANPSTTGNISSLLPDSPSWDSIGFCIANAAVHYITQSTINWINSGFEGSPTFIQNPEQFFMDAADTEAGGLIDELGLGFMCTGAAPRVRIALVNDYNTRTGGAEAYRRKSQCTLTNTINNVERVSESLSKGQLGDFVQLTQAQNRANGQFLLAQDELNRRINVKNNTLNFELRNSDFFPFKKCQTLPTGNGGQTKKVCNTYTPGTVINDELNNVFDAKYKRLSIADEFDEVISALINQLIRTALDQSLDPVEGNYDGGNSDDGGDGGDNNSSSNFITPNIPKPLKLSATCDVSATSTTVGEVVTLGVSAKNGVASKGYVFSWQGIEGVTGTTTSPVLKIEFTEPATSSVISVEVMSGARKTTAYCPAIEVKQPEPIVASCSPDRTSASIGEQVTWTATATGGTGIYSILWGGDENLAGQTQSPATAVYTTKGRKSGSAKIASGNQSVDITCDSKVKVN